MNGVLKENTKWLKGKHHLLQVIRHPKAITRRGNLVIRYRFLKIFRAKEWWEHKLVPIIAIGYITIYLSGEGLLHHAGALLFSLIALVVGASYVSVINDITDSGDDLACGKENRMSLISSRWRLVFPASLLLLGAFLFACLLEHPMSAVLYLLSWITFTCYSFPPIRLKNRNYWGVLADAAGSQLFPSLFILSYISYKTGLAYNGFLFCAVALWSFAYGLRGILGHQFRDKTNDLRIGLKTAGTQLSATVEKKLTLAIISAELLGLAGLLFCSKVPLTIVFLFLYVVFSVSLASAKKVKLILIRSPQDEPYRMLLSDYYTVFMPLAVLVSLAVKIPASMLIILLHGLLFPRNIIRVAVEMKNVVKQLVQPLIKQ